MKYYGLYKITNLTNGKMYIGQHVTDNLEDGYMGSGVLIRRALKKYGEANFRKEWIMFCDDQWELDYWESAFVDDTWIGRSDTYNLRCGGDRGGVSEETKRRMSESAKNRPPITMETRMKMARCGVEHHNFGKHLSEETKRKIGNANRNHHHSDEVRKRMSKSHTGIKFSDERKRKISEKIKGLHWYNNGEMAVMRRECPEGFVPGALKTR